MENENVNNFWTVCQTITKFGMQSLVLTLKSALCSKIKKWKSKMAVDAIIFVCSRHRVLVKPVGRFWRVIRQNACFGTRRCPLGFRKIKISVCTPKIAKTPIFCHLQCISYGKKANNFRTVSPIVTKFGMQSLKVQYAKKIQDGRRLHNLFSSG